MKGSCFSMSVMELVWRFTKMPTFTSAAFPQASEKVRERWFGQIQTLMEPRFNITLGNGGMESLMDRVFIALKIGNL